MSDKQLGTYHMVTDREGLYEIARSNNFEFIVEDVSGLLKAGVSQDTADETDVTPTKSEDTIRLSVVKAFVPNFTQEEIEIRRGNTKMYAASVPTWESGTLEVNDFIGLKTKSVLLAWQRLSYDATTERVGRMADYKRTCTLIEYTPDYQTVVRSWRLEGCWIKGISESQFAMDDNAKRIVSATIRYDRAIPLEVE